MATTEFLQYLRLKTRPRANWMCSAAFDPPPSLLRAIFGEDIDSDNLSYYKKKYKSNCRELVNAYFDRIYRKKVLAFLKEKLIGQFGREHFLKYVWTGEDSVYGMLAELTINTLLKAYEQAIMSWSECLTLTSEGQRLLYFIQYGREEEQIYGLGVLFIYIFTMYLLSSYDEVYFTKEVFQILPSIEPIYEQFPLLRDPFYKFITKQINYKVFFYLLQNIMRKVYHVPDEFFAGFVMNPEEDQIEEITVIDQVELDEEPDEESDKKQ